MPSSVSPLYLDLDFNSPLSDQRAAELIHTLQPLEGARVADLGCGWAELLLRIAVAEPTITAVGIDINGDTIGRGRANASERDLSAQVELIAADVSRWQPDTSLDVAICIGSSHAWGDTAAALDALRAMVCPGGRILLGEGFWMLPPSQAALAALEGDHLETLAGLVDIAVAHGLRPLAISQASADEWDAFESRYALGWERRLLEHPHDPAADELRAQSDEHRRRWLHGYRGSLGFAYLTLVKPNDSAEAT